MDRAGQKVEWAPGQTPNGVHVLYYAHFEVDRHYSKKNQKSVGMRRGGGSRFAKRTGYTPFIMATKDSRIAERQLLVQLLSSGVPSVHSTLPITGMGVSGVFLVELQSCLTKKRQIAQRAGDLDNIVSSYLDILVKAEVLADDGFITSITAFKRPSDKNRITIWLLKDDSLVLDSADYSVSKNKTRQER